MKLHEIKQTLGYETLSLNTVATATGEQTSWMKHWDNNSRVAVLIHKDTLAKLKANMECSSLGIKTAIKQGSKGEYKAHTIVMYNEAEETL
jgi:hypothetical protein